MAGTDLVRWLARFGATLLCSACQFVSNVNDLEIHEDPPIDVGWNCLGVPDQRATPTVVKYDGSVSLVPNGELVENAVLRVCKGDDDTCADPLVPPIYSPDGHVTFEVPGGFNGYLELESPTAMPGRVEMVRPIGRMRLLPELKVIKRETFAAFATAGKVAIDPDLGHVMFWVEDCGGQRASGVAIRVIEGPEGNAAQLSPKTAAYYAVASRLPSIGLGQTDSTGGGGIINLPPVFWTFEAYLVADQRHIATVAARIRPGQVTVFVVEPD
jgi:hypothetical protein